MRGLEYVQRVSQVRDLARRCWFDVLVAALAIVAMLEVALGRGSPGAPRTTLWFCVPAIAILVLPVFARRRFPFAGPAEAIAGDPRDAGDCLPRKGQPSAQRGSS